MIYSMTGYGSAKISNALGLFTADVKTVNNRFLDIVIRLPKELNKFSIPLQKFIEEHLHRGKVEVSINWQPGKEAIPELTYNLDLAKYYYKTISTFQKKVGIEDVITLKYITGLPGVMDFKSPDIEDDAFLKVLIELLKKALKGLIKVRSVEGEHIRQDLIKRKKQLETLYKKIDEKKEEVLSKFEQSLRNKLAELNKKLGLDVNANDERLAVELMLFIDKSDISEELVRLKAHLAALEKLLSKENTEPVGKSLDFLSQELLRETNTIGSKTRDTSVINFVLNMKNEIERIREQIQNLE